MIDKYLNNYKDRCYLLILDNNIIINNITNLDDYINNTQFIIETTIQSIYNNHEIINNNFEMNFKNIIKIFCKETNKQYNLAIVFYDNYTNKGCIHNIINNIIDENHIEFDNIIIEEEDKIYTENYIFYKQNYNYFNNIAYIDKYTTIQQNSYINENNQKLNIKLSPQLFSYYFNKKYFNK